MIHPLVRTVPGSELLPDRLGKRLEGWLSKHLTLNGGGWTVVKFMRRHHPIFVRRRALIVTRAADVREVLDAPDNFHVPYLPKVQETVGSFLLALDGTAEYWRVRVPLQIAGDEVVATVRERSRQEAEQYLERATSDRSRATSVDVIGQLTDTVLERTLPEYLGLPPSPELVDHARALFAGIFLNDLDVRTVHLDAQEAASTLGELVDNELQRRREQEASAQQTDLLTALLREEATEEGAESARPADAPASVERALSHWDIYVTMVGLIAAWATSVSRAVGLAVDVLLEQGEARLAELREAACKDDGERVWDYLLEAMRLHPPAPAVFRTSVANQQVAQGSAHQTRTRQGAPVLAMLCSAMQDELEVYDPPAEEFCPDRPEHVYLVFGHGIHKCFGREIAKEQMTGIAQALFSRPGLQRAGPLEWKGPYPRHLAVKFDT